MKVIIASFTIIYFFSINCSGKIIYTHRHYNDDNSRNSDLSGEKNDTIVIDENQSHEDVIPKHNGDFRHSKQTVSKKRHWNPKKKDIRKKKQKLNLSNLKYTAKILNSLRENDNLLADNIKSTKKNLPVRQSNNGFHEKAINSYENSRQMPETMALTYPEVNEFMQEKQKKSKEIRPTKKDTGQIIQAVIRRLKNDNKMRKAQEKISFVSRNHNKKPHKKNRPITFNNNHKEKETRVMPEGEITYGSSDSKKQGNEINFDSLVKLRLEEEEPVKKKQSKRIRFIKKSEGHKQRQEEITPESFNIHQEDTVNMPQEEIRYENLNNKQPEDEMYFETLAKQQLEEEQAIKEKNTKRFMPRNNEKGEALQALIEKLNKHNEKVLSPKQMALVTRSYKQPQEEIPSENFNIHQEEEEIMSMPKEEIAPEISNIYQDEEETIIMPQEETLYENYNSKQPEDEINIETLAKQHLEEEQSMKRLGNIPRTSETNNEMHMIREHSIDEYFPGRKPKNMNLPSKENNTFENENQLIREHSIDEYFPGKKSKNMNLSGQKKNTLENENKLIREHSIDEYFPGKKPKVMNLFDKKSDTLENDNQLILERTKDEYFPENKMNVMNLSDKENNPLENENQLIHSDFEDIRIRAEENHILEPHELNGKTMDANKTPKEHNELEDSEENRLERERELLQLGNRNSDKHMILLQKSDYGYKNTYKKVPHYGRLEALENYSTGHDYSYDEFELALPGPPIRVNVTNVTNTDARLSWTHIGPLEPDYYIIYYKPYHAVQPFSEISGVTNEYYKFTNLSPKTKYEMYVVAVNYMGRGAPSALVRFTTNGKAIARTSFSEVSGNITSLLHRAANSTEEDDQYHQADITSEESSHAHSRAKIGKHETLEDYPYSASIQRMGAHYATGALLGMSWVLTSAAEFYNVRETIRLFQVRVGSVNCKKHGYTSHIQSIAVHPEFTYGLPSYDISLVKTARAFVKSAVVKPIQLSSVSKKVADAKFLTTYWPRIVVNDVPVSTTAAERVLHHNMRVSTQKLVPNHQCQAELTAVNTTLDDNSLCLTRIKVHHSLCMPDAGAPVVAEDLLWGITSGWVSADCPAIVLPTLVTRISGVRSWIDEQMSS